MAEKINEATSLPDRYTPSRFYNTFRTATYPTIIKLITTIKLLDENLQETKKPLLLEDSEQDKKFAAYLNRSVTPMSQNPEPNTMDLVAGFRYAVQEYRSNPEVWNKEIRDACLKGIVLPVAY